MTGKMASRWERAATSGMTPPYSLKISIWETTTLESSSGVPFLGSPETMAAAVSSQELSMLKIFIEQYYSIRNRGVKVLTRRI